MDSVKLEIGTQGDWIILVISGRLDRMNAEEVGQQGEELLSRSSKLALDLTGLEYISSAGLRIMFRMLKIAQKARKSLVICGATGLVREVLEDSNMDVLVDWYDSIRQLP